MSHALGSDLALVCGVIRLVSKISLISYDDDEDDSNEFYEDDDDEDNNDKPEVYQNVNPNLMTILVSF